MVVKGILLMFGLLVGVDARAIPGEDPRLARDAIPAGTKVIDLTDVPALVSAVRASGLEPRVFFEQAIVRPWLEGSGYALFFEGKVDLNPERAVAVLLSGQGALTGNLAYGDFSTRYAINADLAHGMRRTFSESAVQISNDALVKDLKRHLGTERLRTIGAELHKTFPQLDSAWIQSVLDDRTNFVLSQYLGISTHPSEAEVKRALTRKLEFSRQLWRLNHVISPGQPGAGTTCKKWIVQSVQFLLQAARRQRR